MAKVFLGGRLLRPIAMERTSCRNGTYVLLLWDVCPAAWDVIIHRIKSLSLRKENA